HAGRGGPRCPARCALARSRSPSCISVRVWCGWAARTRCARAWAPRPGGMGRSRRRYDARGCRARACTRCAGRTRACARGHCRATWARPREGATALTRLHEGVALGLPDLRESLTLQRGAVRARMKPVKPSVQPVLWDPGRAWRRSRTGLSLAEAHASVPVPEGASVWRKLLAYAGPGFLVAVGYMDPGNWA